MKKLIALLLALVCVFSMVACNGNGDGGDGGNGDVNTADILKIYGEYLAASVPTKSEITSTTTENQNVLVSTVTLTTGKVGQNAASQFVSKIQTFNAIENGMLNLVDESISNEWYLEGKGVSTNKGRSWDSEGKDFAPIAGSLQLNLAEENFTSVTYNKDKGELVLVCPAETSANVIGYYLPNNYDHAYETTVTLTAFGDRITGIKIAYTLQDVTFSDEFDSPESWIEIGEIFVEIDAVYSYGLQTIDFNGYKG